MSCVSGSQSVELFTSSMAQRKPDWVSRMVSRYQRPGAPKSSDSVAGTPTMLFSIQGLPPARYLQYCVTLALDEIHAINRC